MSASLEEPRSNVLGRKRKKKNKNKHNSLRIYPSQQQPHLATCKSMPEMQEDAHYWSPSEQQEKHFCKLGDWRVSNIG